MRKRRPRLARAWLRIGAQNRTNVCPVQITTKMKPKSEILRRCNLYLHLDPERRARLRGFLAISTRAVPFLFISLYRSSPANSRAGTGPSLRRNDAQRPPSAGFGLSYAAAAIGAGT